MWKSLLTWVQDSPHEQQRVGPVVHNEKQERMIGFKNVDLARYHGPADCLDNAASGCGRFSPFLIHIDISLMNDTAEVQRFVARNPREICRGAHRQFDAQCLERNLQRQ